ncbi:MAG: leucine-rich repeat protein, partial [Opitutaceae bacterium]
MNTTTTPRNVVAAGPAYDARLWAWSIGLYRRVFLAAILGLLGLVVCGSTTLFAGSFTDQNITYTTTLGSPNTAAVTNSTGVSGAITIPATISDGMNTYQVTSIGINAFGYCTGLTSVTIPSSVTTIGDYAFDSCSGLTGVTIPSGVTTIGTGAFQYCTGIVSMTIPSSVTSIGSYAFYYCSGLTSVTIPSGVTIIGTYAFFGCTGLTSMTIPSSVTTIGAGAFAACSGLSSITVDANNFAYSSVGGVLFNKNQTTLVAYPDGNLNTTYSITTGVTSIEGGAFQNCTNLTSVTIPSSVTTIGAAAFYGCTGLTSVYFLGNAPTAGFNAFNNLNVNARGYFLYGVTGWSSTYGSLTMQVAAISDAPTGVAAVGGSGQAVVSFTAPAFNGGATISGYTVTSSPGGLTATGASSPITVTGLTNGTPYTFTVRATNSVGAGSASSASAAVTPVNVAPTLAAIAVSGTEDTTLTFTAENFTGAYADTEGAALASITVVTLPATGQLKLSGSNVTASQVIPAANLGNLTYAPAANENGAKTFTVTASDGTDSSVAATVTMTLAPVNDAPSFVLPAIWTARASGSRNWTSIASSADGTKLAAVEYTGQIYTSTDSGVTWTAQASGSRNWVSIASS